MGVSRFLSPLFVRFLPLDAFPCCPVAAMGTQLPVWRFPGSRDHHLTVVYACSLHPSLGCWRSTCCLAG